MGNMSGILIIITISITITITVAITITITMLLCLFLLFFCYYLFSDMSCSKQNSKQIARIHGAKGSGNRNLLLYPYTLAMTVLGGSRGLNN